MAKGWRASGDRTTAAMWARIMSGRPGAGLESNRQPMQTTATTPQGATPCKRPDALLLGHHAADPGSTCDNLIPIDGDPDARRQTVRDRFPHLDHAEVRWVAQNFDFIAGYPVFSYQEGESKPRAVWTSTRKVYLVDSELRGDPGLVNVIYSLDRLLVPDAANPLTRLIATSVRHVRMAAVEDQGIARYRRRAERIGQALA